MKLIRYIDNRFQELAVIQAQLGRMGAYSALKDGESNALQFVTKIYRFCFTVLLVPKVFFDFFLVNVKIKRMPMPSVDILKAQQQQAESEQAFKTSKKARKLGFN